MLLHGENGKSRLEPVQVARSATRCPAAVPDCTVSLVGVSGRIYHASQRLATAYVSYFINSDKIL